MVHPPLYAHLELTLTFPPPNIYLPHSSYIHSGIRDQNLTLWTSEFGLYWRQILTSKDSRRTESVDSNIFTQS